MIDFHTHILPGIDDGSRDINMTMKMINAEIEQGVDRIVLTPHFYAHKDSPDNFFRRRQQAFDEIRLYLTDMKTPEFKLGAEVFFFPGIGKSKRLSEFCFEGTNLLLLELPFEQWTESTFREVMKIIEDEGLQIILAHIERFYHYQKDITIWNKILNLPIIPQINAECFLKWSSRRFANRFIKDGHDIILGTDAHNDSSRPVNMADARRIIEKKFGNEYLSGIDDFGKRLWEND
ncbi:CpsB/CapC family capsule biosynthesis tyrosine phosphatase [Butyrivibrio sp. AE3004]|uniref:CpsB/CapC family capsule biosynthesis tyrosine phosphatase n=1 Tax=Butyrivibrio sp. AE3004 TaxID=1506994 RepID=UPI0004948225|nr:CpsB/CapC family capsule biosynthesis tyrosine phosphatase [Butyrivibrio sp. AE3004]